MKPSSVPRIRSRLLAAALALGLAGCASWRVDHAARVATGFASHVLCDDIFVSGADPDTTYAERVRPLPGMGLVNWAMTRTVDRDRREVTVSVAGAFTSTARRLDGQGCVALPAAQAAALPAPGFVAPPASPDPWGMAPRPAADPHLRAALDSAFADPPGAVPHHTKALVVLHDGRLVGERYAPGYGVDTPLPGFSATKSVTHTLLGILVRQGRLRLDQPLPLPCWQDPADPRHAVTLEHLVRHTSGLDLPQDNGGFDVNSRILYVERDKAAAVAAAPLAAPPGSRFAYADSNYLLLSRVLRDTLGGGAAGLARFAQHELFGPLGMRHVVIDFDSTGTAIGASHLMASARDWARLGQLYLDDGVTDGRRILPPDWVRLSATPTLDSGYGAGFWTNLKPGRVPRWGAPWGLSRAPRDTFFARGFMGQFIVVVPSRRLVLARLSAAGQRGDDIEETDRIVGAVLAALDAPR